MQEIIIYGDSIMKGVTYDDELDRYKTVKARQFARLKESGYKVSILAHMGKTIEYALNAVKSVKPLNPEKTVAVLEFGGNDCDFDWQDVSDRPDGSFEPKTDEKKFCEMYRQCIQYLKSMGTKVYVATLVPLDPGRYFMWITKNKSCENILKWLGDITMLYRWHEYYKELGCMIARETGALLIDLRTPFLKSHKLSSLICCDGIHPSEAGHLLIEKIIEDSLLCPT
jgi:lysophospholipase L1-like esterase